MRIMMRNNKTGEILVKAYVNTGCPNCGYGSSKQTAKTYQQFYDRVFGKETYTFYYAE